MKRRFHRTWRRGSRHGRRPAADPIRWYHGAVAHRYVDALNGRDRNSGASPDRPWKTLRRALRSTLRPGDALLLRRDRVWTEPLRMTGSGTAARPIVVGAYGAG